MNKNIVFDKIISNSSVYGIIWSGKYKNKKCALKLVVLSSGKTKSKYFKYNDKVPFLHKEFLEKKCMNVDNFMFEVKAYVKLSKLNFAPKVYDYGIIKDFPIHYGYIIAEKMDCSVKDILLKRRLKSSEKDKINQAIDILHRSGVVHGDMKPSNIGVYLDKDSYIKECYFFDCSKVKYASNYEKEDFCYLIEHDIRNYKKHYIKNSLKK
jgi:tRNA A-37 threonylcarbamoyl transferase component Bud32